MRTTLLATAALIVALPHIALAITYSGSLMYDETPGDNELAVFGVNWPVDEQVWFSWEVSSNPDGSWHYGYTFHTPGPGAAISHMLIELSPSFTESEMLNFSGPGTVSLGTNSSANGNPDMPDSMWSAKFTPGGGYTEYSFSFDAFRSPVWGDFYAKCGAPPPNTNRAWNLGFTAGDTDPDDAPSDGSIGFHILRPDTVTDPVPEPGTLGLFALGAAGLIWWRRRRS